MLENKFQANLIKELKARFPGCIVIYYWMTAYHIPFECQKWHLNRLLMLIRICNAENKPPKKRSKRDLYRHHAEVNAANRKKFNSKG